MIMQVRSILAFNLMGTDISDAFIVSQHVGSVESESEVCDTVTKEETCILWRSMTDFPIGWCPFFMFHRPLISPPSSFRNVLLHVLLHSP